MSDPKTAAGFRQHVAEKRFSIVRQAVFDVKTLSPIHDEWLVRFDADDGLDRLIRPAEISGAIAELDLAMLAQAIKTLNVDKRRRPIAVNLSGASLDDPAFEARLLACLDMIITDPTRLMFELTETWNLKELNPAIRIMTLLSERGHELCLDDVGAGAASIRYLRAFKTDWLKIDGEFVQAAVNSERERIILRGLLSLSKPLGVKFIAEGVETEAVLNFVKAEGFKAAQGYWLSKPEKEPLRRV